MKSGKLIKIGVLSWLTLRRGSRPWRYLRWLVLASVEFKPIRAAVAVFLRRFPNIKRRLVVGVETLRIPSAVQGTVVKPSRLPARRTEKRPFFDDGDERTFYIFVDHTISCPTNTGVQRTVRGVSAGLAQNQARVRYVKWDPARGECVFINRDERAALAAWDGPQVSLQEQRGYQPPDEESLTAEPGPGDWLIVPEVTHITFQEAPVSLDLILWARRNGIQIGFVFYDAIPFFRPEFSDVANVHADYMRVLRLADAIWPISRWSADDLLSFWAAFEKASDKTIPRVSCLPLPGSLGWPRVTSPRATGKLILSVGTLEPRKNQLALIRAFEAVQQKAAHRDWRLVLTGNLHPLVAREVAEACARNPAISYIGYAAEDRLKELFDDCAFTAFPSLIEGYGLPILESLWCGKPCLCANFGSMAEIAEGGGCLTVDVRRPEALTEGLERLMDDGGLRRRLTEEALARPMIDWSDYARALCDEVRRATPAVIYYWIDHTRSYPNNTGIQRVVRQLARAWLEAGQRLVPVCYAPENGGFGPVGADELIHLERWNGPFAGQWSSWVRPSAAGPNSWFVMPELPLNMTAADQCRLREFAAGQKLHTAAIFFDAIPWKMKDIYPATYGAAHYSYMMALGQYDRVFAISKHSAADLRDVLSRPEKEEAVSAIVMAVPLPEELPETPRVTQAAAAIGQSDAVRVLCVGTVEPRKNYETLLNAFVRASSLSKCRLELTIAGGDVSVDSKLVGRVRAFIADHQNIHWELSPDDTRLKELYSECDFTVFPSIEEGYGLPIFESLWLGKPVICADFGAMAEAAGGGCVTVDVRDVGALAGAMVALADDPRRTAELSRQAMSRKARTWLDYARDVASAMGELAQPRTDAALGVPSPAIVAERAQAMSLQKRPTLSLCISTYNRANWLAVSLKNWASQFPKPIDGVELVVCDNASTDHTYRVVQPYLGRPDFSFRRNPRNVGMLGNLRETAQLARGDYIWIVGDDDLVLPGAIERILKVVREHPEVALVYINYAYTRIDDAAKVGNLDEFFRKASPIVPPEEDRFGPIRTICSRNENFFTAIYTLVFRRDHAVGAYCQDTSGRPFSSLATCVPTTNYVLKHMMEEPGVWIGEPMIVVNLNVSWMQYAPLWILERIPEVYELAERKGVAREEIDRWRRHTLPSLVVYFRQLLENDPLGNAEFVSLHRVLRRFRHLPEFADYCEDIRKVYEVAHQQKNPIASEPSERLFAEVGDRRKRKPGLCH